MSLYPELKLNKEKGRKGNRREGRKEEWRSDEI